MHTWGAENVDWRGISDAAEYIAMYLRKYGLVPVRDRKEKYGTVRVYCSFGWHSIIDLTHPGYAWVPYKRNGILWKICYSRTVMPFLFRLLNYIVYPYHKWLYRKAYRSALKKWPLLREEILSGADYTELLEEFGVHRVKTGDRCYTIHIDWHPQNFSARYPEKEEDADTE